MIRIKEKAFAVEIEGYGTDGWGSQLDNVEKWCNDHLGKFIIVNLSYSKIILFENEDDAVACILRWS